MSQNLAVAPEEIVARMLTDVVDHLNLLAAARQAYFDRTIEAVAKEWDWERYLDRLDKAS